jgi:hypothetical protein
MRELAKLRAMNGAERRQLAFSLAATPLVASSLALFGYRRTHAALSRLPGPRASRFSSAAEASVRARSVARVVAIAAGRGPIRATCLRRSLLVWWLLGRDGIETQLKVGVNRASKGLQAHAWVEFMGRPLGEPDDVAERFLPFAKDFGAPPERTS